MLKKEPSLGLCDTLSAELSSILSAFVHSLKKEEKYFRSMPVQFCLLWDRFHYFVLPILKLVLSWKLFPNGTAIVFGNFSLKPKWNFLPSVHLMKDMVTALPYKGTLSQIITQSQIWGFRAPGCPYIFWTLQMVLKKLLCHLKVASSLGQINQLVYSCIPEPNWNSETSLCFRFHLDFGTFLSAESGPQEFFLCDKYRDCSENYSTCAMWSRTLP